MLQLVKWGNKFGETKTLRLYEVLATVWKKVSDLLKLDGNTITNVETKYNRDPEQCIRDVMRRWLNDENKSANYQCTWNGLCQLLEDVELSTVSTHLKEALAADASSFHGNTQLPGLKNCYSYISK